MRILVDTTHGEMLVNDLDPYIGVSLIQLGEFSRGETELFEAVVQPGWVVADIGANIGTHTLTFSRLVGDGVVWAFEPQRLVFQTLCANLALNNRDNVVAVQKGVGRARELLHVNTLRQDVAHNFGGVSIRDLVGGKEELEIVPFTTPCHFMKIDVEGMEVEVLEGAADMIRDCRPFLYVECDTGGGRRPDPHAALVATLEDLGYTPRWHIVPMFCPDNPNGVTKNPWKGNLVNSNFVCAPPGDTRFDHLPHGRELRL